MALLWDLVFTIPMPPIFGVGFPRCRGGLCHGSVLLRPLLGQRMAARQARGRGSWRSP